LTHAPPTALYTLSLHDALPIFGIGPDLALHADGRRAAQVRVGVYRAVLADAHARLDIGRGGIDDRDTGQHVGLVDTGAHQAIGRDRKSTRLNSSHVKNSYAVFC